jgi:hypothetical protein
MSADKDFELAIQASLETASIEADKHNGYINQHSITIATLNLLEPRIRLMIMKNTYTTFKTQNLTPDVDWLINVWYKNQIHDLEFLIACKESEEEVNNKAIMEFLDDEKRRRESWSLWRARQ